MSEAGMREAKMSEGAMAERGNALQIYHININCSDFDRALAFYSLLGFRLLVDLTREGEAEAPDFGAVGLGPVLRLPQDCAGRAGLLALGDDPRATRIDLIEWRRPVAGPRVARDLAQLGMARLCLKVRDAQALHDVLVAHGHVVYSPPTPIPLAGTLPLVFCCEDPDGTVIEFMQFRKG